MAQQRHSCIIGNQHNAAAHPLSERGGRKPGCVAPSSIDNPGCVAMLSQIINIIRRPIGAFCLDFIIKISVTEKP